MQCSRGSVDDGRGLAGRSASSMAQLMSRRSAIGQMPSQGRKWRCVQSPLVRGVRANPNERLALSELARVYAYTKRSPPPQLGVLPGCQMGSPAPAGLSLAGRACARPQRCGNRPRCRREPFKAHPTMRYRPASLSHGVVMSASSGRAPRPPHSPAPRSAQDPSLRHRIHGPVRPMEHPSLLARLLRW